VRGKKPSHDRFSVLLGASVVAIASIQLVRHPLRDGTFVSFDRLDLVRVARDVLGDRVRQVGRERLAPLEALGREPQCCRL
jgi:hypothetical protein